MALIVELYMRIFMALVIGLYMTDLYATNYWIVSDGFVCH